MSNESKEKEIRTLEAEIKNLQIKKANIEIEVHNFDKRQVNITNNIAEFEQKKILALNEYKQEYSKLEEIKKEAQGIKDDCRAEVAKAKKEWDDLADEAKLITEGKKILEDQKVSLEKDRQALKEDAKKLAARQASLDQIESSLKTEKEEQDVREKGLMNFARLTNNRDAQSLADSANLKKEGERLAFIAKSLESKRQEFEKMSGTLQQRSNDLDLREKNLKSDSDEIYELKSVLNDKVKEAEASNKQYSDAYARLAQKEKEIEIRELRARKLIREKDVEKELKQLEAELKK